MIGVYCGLLGLFTLGIRTYIHIYALFDILLLYLYGGTLLEMTRAKDNGGGQYRCRSLHKATRSRKVQAGNVVV
jgi:hypothetical protein